jgi:hypothetical protein
MPSLSTRRRRRDEADCAADAEGGSRHNVSYDDDDNKGGAKPNQLKPPINAAVKFFVENPVRLSSKKMSRFPCPSLLTRHPLFDTQGVLAIVTCIVFFGIARFILRLSK